MEHFIARVISWAAIALMMPAQALADESDSIRTVTPLFEPLVVEDGTPPENPEAWAVLPPDDNPTTLSLRSGTRQSGFPSDGNVRVGTPSTACDVSQTGAATWSLTFDAPKGSGGLEPAIGLAYSSQSGNGLAGWGVGISGISSITRGMKDTYHDGAVRGIRYDGGDALLLDGKRLLLARGTEGGTGAVYVPEGDPFTTVTVTSSDTVTGPLSFEVSSPDGMVSRYGETAASRVVLTDAGGHSRVLSWSISCQEDPNGNYIEYSYEQDHLTLYPVRISYGGNRTAGAGADNSIRFSYSGVEAGTLRTFVACGVRGGIYKCLTEVRTMTGESVFRRYTLDYNPFLDGSSRRFERLVAVTVRNGAGEQMFPVTLEWNAMSGHARSVTEIPFTLSSAHPGATILDSLFIAADMDGNGLADIIRLSKVRLGGSDTGFAYIHPAEAGNGGLQYASTPLRVEIGQLYEKSNQARVMAGNAVADLDGDGLSDLLVALYEKSGSTVRAVLKVIYGKDVRQGNAAIYGVATIQLPADCGMPSIVTGDLDGNGREDVFFVERKKTGSAYRARAILSKQGYFTTATTSITLPGEPGSTFLGDYDGDGLTDAIIFHGSGYKVLRNTGASYYVFSDTHALSSTAITKQWRMEQGDFNGDGQPDFVYVGVNSSSYRFAMGNGDGTFTVTLAADYELHDQDNDRDDDLLNLIPADLDGDGITDLVVAKGVTVYHGFPQFHTSLDHMAVGWLVSDGAALTEVRRAISQDPDDGRWYNYMLADFDGDGRPELMNYGRDMWSYDLSTGGGVCLHLYGSAGDGPGTGMLATSADGLGAETAFTYATTADGGVYGHEYGTPFPMQDVHWPLVLVSGMTRDMGMAGVHELSYRYRGMKNHASGKGFLGFSDTAVRDAQTGVTRQSGVKAWNTAHYVPSVAYSVTSAGTASDSTATVMSVSGNVTSRYLSLPVSAETTDMDGNVTLKTTGYNIVDGYVTVERTEYGSPLMYRQVTYNDHVRKGNRWLPRTVVSEQRHMHDEDPYTDTTTYQYDAAGNVTRKTEHATGMPLTTATTYDARGNVTSAVRSGSGVTASPRYFQYDATGRFVTRRWGSADDASWQYTRDVWGNVLTETDASEASNLLTTAYQRDGWGDVVSVTDPTGVTETTSREWGTTRDSRFSILRTAPGRAPVRIWHDVTGRERVTTSKTVCDTDVETMLTLNAWGKTRQVVRRTGENIDIEILYYDTRGRVNWTFRTGRGETSYTYGNRSRTALHGGREYVTTYDAWGNVLTSSDPISSVEYTYGSMGKPVSAASGGSEVTIQYDQAGRRTRLSDPDAGTTLYTYSADGKLLSQTDGRGITTQNSYDALGRLTSSVSDTMATAYTYGTSGHGKLRLVRRQTGSMSDEYTYDAYGRVTFSKRTFPDGMQMGHTYAYNSLGQLSGHTYPSNYNITYTYDVNGQRDGIWAGDAHLWYPQSCNGKVTRYHYGNTTVTDSVSSAGQLLERYAVRDGQSGKLCRMAFTWDGTTGNMASRTGVGGADVTETFTYDTLDRLTGVSQGGSVTDAITYGDDGNILSRTGMGAYDYLGSKPHAVTSVDNTDYLIASASQQIEYNPLGKAVLIREGTHAQRLFYGPDGTRWLTVDSVNGQVASKTYYQDDFEMRVAGGHTRKYHYLEEGLLTYMYDSSVTDHYYLMRDNVGSVTHVLNGEGGTMFDACYDAWGRQAVTKDLIGFHRGYGGHEMLPQYRLVNMDGRLYDYALGRFLSPDNYVQEPHNSQNFNRYTYCLNNPLKYTDPDGEFLILSAFKGFLKGVRKLISGHGKWYSPFYEAYKGGVNDLKVTWGLFKGKPLQVLSRFTWELPQTIIGYIYSNIKMALHDVDEVRYFDGATFIINKTGKSNGITISNYININTENETPMDENKRFAPYLDGLFAHEYGHYIQSQRTGWGYLFSHGIPSLFNLWLKGDDSASYNGKTYDSHDVYWTEIDANEKAYEYFLRKGYLSDWKYSNYPLKK